MISRCNVYVILVFLYNNVFFLIGIDICWKLCKDKNYFDIYVMFK